MLEQVLVPLDGSPLAECVLPHVIATCSALGSQLTLLHVLERPQSLSDTQTIDPLEWHIQKTEATQYLATIANRLESGDLSPQTVVLEGRAAETIVDFTAQNGIQLIILSTHGKSGLSEWNVSSTVQKVILRAGKSVLLIRAHQPVPALSELHYHKILVPLDGSLRAEHALPVAKMLSNFHNAELILAHVVTKPEVPRRAPLTQEELSLSERLTELNQIEGAKYLQQLEEQFTSHVKTHLLVSDNPPVALHNLAQQEEVDLVLFNAHGLSGEARWPYGSVATHFIVHGTSSLLVIQDFPVEAVSNSQVGIIPRAAHLWR